MDADVTPNILPATNEDTVGPYFPIYFEDPELMDISRLHHGLVVGPEGTPMILRKPTQTERVWPRPSSTASMWP